MIGPVFKLVEKESKPSKEDWSELSKVSKVMMHQFGKLQVEEGMLIRKIESVDQIVLPEKFQKLVLTELHNNMGHLGAEKVEQLARQRFYWPYMGTEIAEYIKTKCPCIASKQPPIPEKAPLVPILASSPFEMICIDFLHLDKSQGYEHVLIVTDHFTRFSQAYATKNETSLTAAKKLFNEFILQFGFPARIHHDRGEAFNSSLFKELHRLAGIDMSNTSPYHPQGNGSAERLNRTLINMLKAIPENEKKNWVNHLPKLMFAYNSTVNKTTGFSPFQLMFGRESRLPIDCIMPLTPKKTTRKTYDKFVKEWKVPSHQSPSSPKPNSY